MSGMFFNADGQFGICTEATIKLYPEHEKVEDQQDIWLPANLKP